MKAEELMIGDWVSHKGTPVQVERICKDEFDTERIVIGWKDESDYTDFIVDIVAIYLDEVEPLPLTAEILEKNGFKDIDSDPEGCNGYNIYYRSGDGWGINVNDFKLHYVHELQHFLRLCGLNELAENFKVE